MYVPRQIMKAYNIPKLRHLSDENKLFNTGLLLSNILKGFCTSWFPPVAFQNMTDTVRGMISGIAAKVRITKHK